MQTQPPLDQIPPHVVALDDYEALARTRLDDNAWIYLNGGAADGITIRNNRGALDSISLVPRVLRDMKAGSTSLTLLGLQLAHPVLLAPVAYQALFHRDGELATAMAAAATDALMVVSTQASRTLESVAQAGEGAPQWFQLYIHADRDVTLELVRRAEAAQYRAIVLTVDAPVNGIRYAEQRASFRLPPHVRAANMEGLDSRPSPNGHGHPVFDVAMRGAPTWADVEWLRQITALPIVLKGILSVEDARLAASSGADAIVVSNHGGRTLDTLVPTAYQLPYIADAMEGRIPILVDGGIRRGTDIVKALALGAQAVMIGRAYIFALASAGALGVAHAVKLLVDELAVSMALVGARRLEDIVRDHVIVPHD